MKMRKDHIADSAEQALTLEASALVLVPYTNCSIRSCSRESAMHRVEIYVIDRVYERFSLNVWGFVLSMTSERVALAV